MGLLGGAGEDAGLSAARELHKTATEVAATLDNETIPDAQRAILVIVAKATEALQTAAVTFSSVLTQAFNRLEGASLPVDLHFEMNASLTGKIGDFVLNKNMAHDGDSGPAQRVEVQG